MIRKDVKLFIDDIREPWRWEDEYIVIRSYAEAIGWMREHGCPEHISFDHDLGSIDGLDGIDIVKWMIEVDLDNNGDWIPNEFEFMVHSANPIGAANIVGTFESYFDHRAKYRGA
jgi:hypothetical protein